MKNKVILLSSDQLGKGEPGLGEGLLETFFTLLKQQDELPVAVFCMNRGVFTLTESSFVSLQLKELEEKGKDHRLVGSLIKKFENVKNNDNKSGLQQEQKGDIVITNYEQLISYLKERENLLKK